MNQIGGSADLDDMRADARGHIRLDFHGVLRYPMSMMWARAPALMSVWIFMILSLCLWDLWLSDVDDVDPGTSLHVRLNLHGLTTFLSGDREDLSDIDDGGPRSCLHVGLDFHESHLPSRHGTP